MQEMQRLLDFSAYWKQQQTIAPHANASLMPPQHWQEELSYFPEEADTEDDVLDIAKFAAELLLRKRKGMSAIAAEDGPRGHA